MVVEDAAAAEVEPDENFEYKLVGVVLHMGTADAGHYLSYININRNT
jgi:ubiquitin carboxyl-terminal hydrolase 34